LTFATVASSSIVIVALIDMAAVALPGPRER
jgi:hypothetical protein